MFDYINFNFHYFFITGSSKKFTESNNKLPKATDELSVKKTNRNEDIVSPIPEHKEIEIIHNLTRSPERKKKLSIDSDKILDNEQTEDDSMQVSYDSFQIYPQPPLLALPAPSTTDRSDKNRDSFQECPVDQRIVGLSSPVPLNTLKKEQEPKPSESDRFLGYPQIENIPNVALPSLGNGKIDLQPQFDNSNFSSFQICPQGSSRLLPQPKSLPIFDSSSKDTEVSQEEISNNILPEDPRVVYNYKNDRLSNSKQIEDTSFTGSILGGYWERNLDMPMTSKEVIFIIYYY